MAEITSTQTGDWNVGATWVGGVSPGAADTFIIANAHAITLTANQASLGGTTDAGGELIFNEDIELTGLTGTFRNNGTLTMAAGTAIKGNTAAAIYLLSDGTGVSTLNGTSAKVITLKNDGAGNGYIKIANSSVWKFVDIYAIPFETGSKSAVMEDCDIICWTSVSTGQQPIWRMKRCFLSGYGSNFRINPATSMGFDPQWENIVVGYRRDGTAAAVTRAFVIQQGRLTIRNFIGNYTTLVGTDGHDTAIVIDNMGYVDAAMLPDTGSALDLAVVGPGIGYEYRNQYGAMERSTAAKKTGDYGDRLSPASSVVDSNHPLETSIYIPIATGDDIAVSVYGRRHTMTNDCAEVEIDPEGAWFTPDTSAPVLADDTWTEFTPSAAGAGGAADIGMVRIVLRLMEFQGGAYMDWADMVVVAGGITYNINFDSWNMGQPAVSEPAAAGGPALGPFETGAWR